MPRSKPAIPSRPITIGMSAALFNELEGIRRKTGVSSTSLLVRDALCAFNTQKVAEAEEEKRATISVRIPDDLRERFVDAAERKNQFIGHLLEAALVDFAQKFKSKKGAVKSSVPASTKSAKKTAKSARKK